MQDHAATRPVGSIHVGERVRKTLGNLTQLIASIEEVGLLHPIVVTPSGELIAGERRLRAVQRLGWTTVPVHVVPLADIVLGELVENGVRRDFQITEQVAIWQQLYPREAEAARSRQGTRTDLGRELPGNFPESTTRDRIAAYLGISGKHLEKAVAVVRAAEANPERYGELPEEMDRDQRVHGVYRKMRVREEADRIAAEPPPLPTGPFRVIVADPPWHYANREDDASHRARNPYADMDLDAIRALPIGGLAHDDAVLWLWTTNAFMREAFTVLDAWGFTERTILTWVKDRMGAGDWLRGQTEHCLLAARGSPTVVLTNQTTVLEAPRGVHSAKPDAFYELVEALCPGSKVDLFARQARPGWSVWGGGVAA